MSPTSLVSKFLFESPESDDLRHVKTFADRLALRIYTVPSLLAYMSDVHTNGDKVELEFNHIPEEVIKTVSELIGCPSQVYAYKSKQGHPKICFVIPVPEKEKKMASDEFGE